MAVSMHRVQESTFVLDVQNVSKKFASASSTFWAVRDVSLTIAAGECVALVGESGSGKTTLANMTSGLMPPTSGTVRLAPDLDVADLARRRRGRRLLASHLQLAFQDPYGSLDPSKTVESLVAEPLLLLGLTRKERDARVRHALDTVGMTAALARRRPRELSGGQRQRVGIARALAPGPELLVLDEPVASLDVSIQGQVLSLLKTIREQTGVAQLVIAHDLGVVRAISDRTLVMYRGSIVEEGPTSSLLSRPVHPYTQGMLWSATADGRRAMPADARSALAIDARYPADGDTGCVFRERCWRSIERCGTQVDTVHVSADHWGDCNVPIQTTTAERGHADVITAP